jgi:hypothetical protein
MHPFPKRSSASRVRPPEFRVAIRRPALCPMLDPSAGVGSIAGMRSKACASARKYPVARKCFPQVSRCHQTLSFGSRIGPRGPGIALIALLA